MTLLARMNKLLEEHHEASKQTYFIATSSREEEFSLIKNLNAKDDSLITVFRLYD